jgi:hypothetical protein
MTGKYFCNVCEKYFDDKEYGVKPHTDAERTEE